MLKTTRPGHTKKIETDLVIKSSPTIADLVQETLGNFKNKLKVPRSDRKDEEVQLGGRIEAVKSLETHPARHPAIDGALLAVAFINKYDSSGHDLRAGAIKALKNHSPRLATLATEVKTGTEISDPIFAALPNPLVCLMTPKAATYEEAEQWVQALNRIASENPVLALGTPLLLFGNKEVRPLVREAMANIDKKTVDILTGNFLKAPI